MSIIKKITIVNYNLSNIFSIYNALKKINYSPIVSDQAKNIKNTDLLILPGTGAFWKAMDNLRKKKLIKPIIDHISNGKPFLGICLGYQLLFSSSEEFKKTKGLEIFKSKIIQLKKNNCSKINIGWSKVKFKNNNQSKYYYFVHSYFAKIMQKEKRLVNSETIFNKKKICSSIKFENIYATQFHPEKSGNDGLLLLNDTIKNYK